MYSSIDAFVGLPIMYGPPFFDDLKNYHSTVTGLQKRLLTAQDSGSSGFILADGAARIDQLAVVHASPAGKDLLCRQDPLHRSQPDQAASPDLIIPFSQKAQKDKRTLRELAKALLEEKASDELIESLGLSEEAIKGAAMIASMLKEAIDNGNVRAAEYVRDTSNTEAGKYAGAQKQHPFIYNYHFFIFV